MQVVACTVLVYYQVTLSLEYAPTNWFEILLGYVLNI